MTTDIVAIFKEVVNKVSENLEILYPDGIGGYQTIEQPEINYIFGNSQYIKDKLDEYSKSNELSEKKFPLIALFCPVKEARDSRDYFSKSDVSLIIACASIEPWSNEEREEKSFRNILRPIYKRLLEVLLEDRRFEWECDDKVQHGYSENYSYGRYGAYTDTGQKVSDPIDAINISSMKITIKNPNCRRL